MAQKSRYCKFQAVGTSGFCVCHSDQRNEEEQRAPASPVPGSTGLQRTRIPCPVDPRHSIYADQVEAHLKKCSLSAQREFERAQPCRWEGCNLMLSWLSRTSGAGGTPGGASFLGESNPVWHSVVDLSEELFVKGIDGDHLLGVSGSEWASIFEAATEASIQELRELFPHQKTAAFCSEEAQLLMQGKLYDEATSGSGAQHPAKRQKVSDEQDASESGPSRPTTLGDRVSAIVDDGHNSIGVETKKHHAQCASLVNIFAENGLLSSRTEEADLAPRKRVFLEYGCGKGGLTRWLALARSLSDKQCSETYWYMIEREARRNKAEGKLKGEVDCIRLRLDLADFDLDSALPRLVEGDHDVATAVAASDRSAGEDHACGTITSTSNQQTNQPDIERIPKPQREILEKTVQKVSQLRGLAEPVCAVVHAKHLCGGATDLALTSCARAFPPGLAKSAKNHSLQIGIATCCHHRCDTKTYVAPDFLLAVLRRLAQRETRSNATKHPTRTVSVLDFFTALVKHSSWGTDRPHGAPNAGPVQQAGRPAAPAVVSPAPEEQEDAKDHLASRSKTSQTKASKIRVGVCAKRILDLGRAFYCREKLPVADARVLNFVDAAVSPENGLLLAL